MRGKYQVFVSLLLAIAMLIPQVWIAPAASAAVGDIVMSGNFDSGTDGWFKRGTETVTQSTNTAQSGTGSLKTEGRTETWNGPGLDLNSLIPGATYEFSIYGKLLEGTSGSATLILSINQEGLPDDGGRYLNLKYEQVSADSWTELKASHTLNTSATSYQLYVQSDNATVSYNLDTFSAKLTALPDGYEEGGSTVFTYDFEDGLQGWTPRGSAQVATVTDEVYGGAQSLHAFGRTAAWHGAELTNAELESGATYKVTARAKLKSGQSVTTANIKMSENDDNAFPQIIGETPVNDTEWTLLQGTYTATVTKIYFEAPNDAAVSFLIDDVRIEMISPAPDDPGTGHVFNFDDGTTQKWSARGAGTVTVTSDHARSAPNGLQHSGRTDSWNGPSLNVLNIMEAGRTYNVSGYVMLPGKTGDASEVKLSVERKGIGEDAQTGWDTINSAQIGDSGWVQLSGTYQVASEMAVLTLYVESSDVADVIVIDDIKIEEALDQSGITADYEDGTTQGFTRRNGAGGIEATTADSHGGQYSLLTTAESQYDGPILNVMGKMHRNHEYRLSGWVKMAPGQEPTRLRISVQSGDNAYANVSANATVTDAEWVQLSGNFTLRTVPTVLRAYVETADDNGGPRSFYLDDFTLAYVGPVAGPLPIQTELDNLKDLYADYFKLGAAAEPDKFTGTANQLLLKHYNSVVAENSMKPASIAPNPTDRIYTAADQVADYARNNGMDLRFHTLLWHSQGADWMLKDGDTFLTRTPENEALILSRLTAYIEEVVPQYADIVTSYDVVNEVIDEGRPDGMRDSMWYRLTGDRFIRTAFTETRRVLDELYAADPVEYAAAGVAKLYINDYSTHVPKKRDFLFDLVTRLKADGVPIEGVGHQTHINITGPSIQQISDSIRKFAEAGFDTQITELDISVYSNPGTVYDTVPEDIQVKLGYRYKELFKELVKLDEMGKTAGNPEGWISNVTLWGIADDHTWLHNFNNITRQDAPLPFDKRHQAKLAYWGMVEAVKEIVPSKLPLLTKIGNTAQGTPVVDGKIDDVWNRVVALQTESSETFGAGFKTLWDTDHLYVLADVRDSVKTAEDKLELFIKNGGSFTKHEIPRSAAQGVTEKAGGYLVEAAIPLSGNTLGKQVSFDLRVTTGGAQDGSEHGQNGAILSWSDPRNMQHQDTAGYGALTLVAAPKYATARMGTPTIDGVADAIWNSASEQSTGVWVEGTSGATAKFKTLWDADNLYIYAVVNDTVLSDASDNAWEEDSIEIFVDQNNGKTDSYEDDDGQYRINFNNVKTVGGHANEDNYSSAVTIVDGFGYVVEAAIKLDTITPAAGTVIGFDIQVNNDEDGNGSRDSVANWADPSGQSYQNTSMFGVIEFANQPTPSTTPSIPKQPEQAPGTPVQKKLAEAELQELLAKASVNENGKKEIVIDMASGTAGSGYEAVLPPAALDSSESYVIVVTTDAGTVRLPSNMLTGVDAPAGSVSLRIGAASLDNVSESVRLRIGSRPVVDLQLLVEDQAIAWRNPNAPVTVALPYQPTADELQNPDSIVIWYLDNEGNATAVPNGRYDAKTGTVVFSTTHFSTYAVAVVEKTFDDISALSWAKAAIEAMAARDVVQGISETAFNPGADIKRADFLLLLVRALGLQSEGGSAFTDVAATAYYYDAVRIAKGLGIAKGIGDGSFNPLSPITRQEMMVLTTRALAAAGQSVEASGSLSGFADASDVADYAADSVAKLAAAGILKGMDGHIEPDGLVTRAQAAVILYRAMGFE